MFLLIDKPKGITSHDAVNMVRRVTGERKVGHAGTLDPNATGLLIVAVGRESTKRIDKFVKKDKEYEAEIFLGEEKDTDDIEGVTIKTASNKLKSSQKQIKQVLGGFVGKILQEPPKYSAIKIKGKKAYQLARKGLEPVMESREVVIHSIKLTKYKYPILKIRTRVSSGTYIRSLARDVGRELGTFSYLKNLRRTKVGGYSVGDAVDLKELTRENWKESAFQL